MFELINREAVKITDESSVNTNEINEKQLFQEKVSGTI